MSRAASPALRIAARRRPQSPGDPVARQVRGLSHLESAEQAGLLARQHFETGKAVFELNQGGHHDHLVCLQCGRVEEFYDSEIEKRQTKVAKERGK